MKIEIELDVYKALTQRMEHEQDALNDIIGRLLDLPAYRVAPANIEQADWFGYSVRLAVGTELRTNYKKTERIGIVRKDGLELEGQTFPSLSAAAIYVRGQNTNGWRFWKVRDAAGKWQLMQSLR